MGTGLEPYLRFEASVRIEQPRPVRADLYDCSGGRKPSAEWLGLASSLWLRDASVVKVHGISISKINAVTTVSMVSRQTINLPVFCKWHDSLEGKRCRVPQVHPEDYTAVERYHDSVKEKSPPYLHQQLFAADVAEHIEADRSLRSTLTSKGCQFFCTSNGFVGIGRWDEEGDEMLILLGGRVPFVLSSGGEFRLKGGASWHCYVLLGDCYVHSVMDGEVVKDGAETIEVFLV